MAKGESFRSFDKAMERLKGQSKPGNAAEGLGEVLRRAMEASRPDSRVVEQEPIAASDKQPAEMAEDMPRPRAFDAQDKKFFDDAMLITGWSPREKMYWKMNRAILDSYVHDTSYTLLQVAESIRLRRGTPVGLMRAFDAGLKRTLQRAYTSGARKSLEAATKEGLRYGRRQPGQTDEDAKNERLREAEAFAKKAGKTLDEIRAESGIVL